MSSDLGSGWIDRLREIQVIKGDARGVIAGLLITLSVAATPASAQGVAADAKKPMETNTPMPSSSVSPSAAIAAVSERAPTLAAIAELQRRELEIALQERMIKLPSPKAAEASKDADREARDRESRAAAAAEKARRQLAEQEAQRVATTPNKVVTAVYGPRGREVVEVRLLSSGVELDLTVGGASMAGMRVVEVKGSDIQLSAADGRVIKTRIGVPFR